jgi:hypothetical protein
MTGIRSAASLMPPRSTPGCAIELRAGYLRIGPRTENKGRELYPVQPTLHSRLGGKEDPAPSDEGSEAKGLRLDAVE